MTEETRDYEGYSHIKSPVKNVDENELVADPAELEAESEEELDGDTDGPDR